MKQLLNKLKQLLNPVEQPAQEVGHKPAATPAATPPSLAREEGFDDDVLLLEHIATTVTRLAQEAAGSRHLTGTRLVTTDARFAALLDDDFTQRLRGDFDNALLPQLGAAPVTVTLASAIPPQAAMVLPPRLGVVLESDDVPQEGTALLCLLHDGEPVASCKLDAAVKSVYHVGRGPRSSYHPHIVNDLALPQHEVNVSSEQAIVKIEHGRCYLQALRGGCRPLGGSATKVLHRGDEAPVELRDVHTLHELRDGDLIELGGTTLLRFTRPAQ